MQIIKKYSRKWHIWLGVVCAIPLFIVGLTTIFIAHEKSLKLDTQTISSSFFPGYIGSKTVTNEIKTYFKDEVGVEYFGYKSGLHVKKEGEVNPIPFFENHEIRKIAMMEKALVVGTKKALYIQHNGQFKELLKKEIWDISIHDGVMHVTTNKEGLWVSKDLKAWEKKETQVMHSTLTQVSLKKLNLDLHTGKAIFGDALMWIWQDILALCILFFMMSGVYLWYSKKRPSKQR